MVRHNSLRTVARRLLKRTASTRMGRHGSGDVMAMFRQASLPCAPSIHRMGSLQRHGSGAMAARRQGAVLSRRHMLALQAQCMASAHELRPGLSSQSLARAAAQGVTTRRTPFEAVCDKLLDELLDIEDKVTQHGAQAINHAPQLAVIKHHAAQAAAHAVVPGVVLADCDAR